MTIDIRKKASLLLLVLLGLQWVLPAPIAAQQLILPVPGTRVQLSPAFHPPILRGIKVHPSNPLRFDFILEQGNSAPEIKVETAKLIKYFLASLTTPEKDLWVNLSPYEKDRIVPESFGQTEMGRDLLAQDYLLKQITASLIYPEGETGKEFWKKVYQAGAEKLGVATVPINTFNKVWIMPDKAVMYENAQAGTAYIVESKLKVMLEVDYLAGSKNHATENDVSKAVAREIIIPALTKEVNEGKNFAQLRQVYNSLILATWYKKKIKQGILTQAYTNKNKTAGVQIENPEEKQEIYKRYLEAFRKGAFNYIKEEQDPLTHRVLPRKYFSGGITALRLDRDIAMTATPPEDQSNLKVVSTDLAMVNLRKRDSEVWETKQWRDFGHRLRLWRNPARLLLDGQAIEPMPAPGGFNLIFRYKDRYVIRVYLDDDFSPEGHLLLNKFKMSPQVHAYGKTSDGYGYVVTDFIKGSSITIKTKLSTVWEERISSLVGQLIDHKIWINDIAGNGQLMIGHTAADPQDRVWIVDADRAKYMPNWDEQTLIRQSNGIRNDTARVDAVSYSLVKRANPSMTASFRLMPGIPKEGIDELISEDNLRKWFSPSDLLVLTKYEKTPEDIVQAMRQVTRTSGQSIGLSLVRGGQRIQSQMEIAKNQFKSIIKEKQNQGQQVITAYEIGIGRDMRQEIPFKETHEILQVISQAFDELQVTPEEQAKWRVNFVAVDVNSEIVEGLAGSYQPRVSYQLNALAAVADTLNPKAMEKLGNQFKADIIFLRHALYIGERMIDGFYSRQNLQVHSDTYLKLILTPYLTMKFTIEHLAQVGTRYIIENPVRWNQKEFFMPGAQLIRDWNGNTTGVYLFHTPEVMKNIGLENYLHYQEDGSPQSSPMTAEELSRTLGADANTFLAFAGMNSFENVRGILIRRIPDSKVNQIHVILNTREVILYAKDATKEEFDTAHKLSEQGLYPPVAWLTFEGKRRLFMRQVRGQVLGDFRRFNPQQTFGMAKALGETLGKWHRAGWLHGNLKNGGISNILTRKLKERYQIAFIGGPYAKEGPTQDEMQAERDGLVLGLIKFIAPRMVTPSGWKRRFESLFLEAYNQTMTKDTAIPIGPHQVFAILQAKGIITDEVVGKIEAKDLVDAAFDFLHRNQADYIGQPAVTLNVLEFRSFIEGTEPYRSASLFDSFNRDPNILSQGLKMIGFTKTTQRFVLQLRPDLRQDWQLPDAAMAKEEDPAKIKLNRVQIKKLARTPATYLLVYAVATAIINNELISDLTPQGATTIVYRSQGSNSAVQQMTSLGREVAIDSDFFDSPEYKRISKTQASFLQSALQEDISLKTATWFKGGRTEDYEEAAAYIRDLKIALLFHIQDTLHLFNGEEFYDALMNIRSLQLEDRFNAGLDVIGTRLLTAVSSQQIIEVLAHELGHMTLNEVPRSMFSIGINMYLIPGGPRYSNILARGELEAYIMSAAVSQSLFPKDRSNFYEHIQFLNQKRSEFFQGQKPTNSVYRLIKPFAPSEDFENHTRASNFLRDFTAEASSRGLTIDWMRALSVLRNSESILWVNPNYFQTLISDFLSAYLEVKTLYSGWNLQNQLSDAEVTKLYFREKFDKAMSNGGIDQHADRRAFEELIHQDPMFALRMYFLGIGYEYFRTGFWYLQKPQTALQSLHQNLVGSFLKAYTRPLTAEMFEKVYDAFEEGDTTYKQNILTMLSTVMLMDEHGLARGDTGKKIGSSFWDNHLEFGARVYPLHEGKRLPLSMEKPKILETNHSLPTVRGLSLSSIMDISLQYKESQKWGLTLQSIMPMLGGKSINATRLLNQWGQPVHLVAVQRQEGWFSTLMKGILTHMGFRDADVTSIKTSGEQRTSFLISDDAGLDLRFGVDEPGLSGNELQEVKTNLLRTLAGAKEGEWFHLGGAFPTGMRPADIKDIVQTIKSKKQKIAFDLSLRQTKFQMKAALSELGDQDFIKPNLEEYYKLRLIYSPQTRDLSDEKMNRRANELARRIPWNPSKIAAGAQALRRKLNLGAVVVSNDADGAVWVDRHGHHLSAVSSIRGTTRAGAGDALISGILFASSQPGGMSTEEVFRFGMQAGVATSLKMPGLFPDLEEVDRVKPAIRVNEIRMKRASRNNAMRSLTDPKLKLSPEDINLILRIHGQIVVGANSKRYLFHYLVPKDRVGGWDRARDAFHISEVDDQNKIIRVVGSLLLSPENKRHYVDDTHTYRIKLIGFQIRDDKDQQQGILGHFLERIPQGAVLQLNTITNRRTKADMLRAILAQPSISKIFSEAQIEHTKAQIEFLLANEKSGPDNSTHTIYQYSEALKTLPAELASVEQIFEKSLFGRTLLRHGFGQFEITLKGDSEGAVLHAVATKGMKDMKLNANDAQVANGGINFDPGNIDLQLQSKETIPFQMDPAMLKQLQDAAGLTPVILDIQPMTTLRAFLGAPPKN